MVAPTRLSVTLHVLRIVSPLGIARQLYQRCVAISYKQLQSGDLSCCQLLAAQKHYSSENNVTTIWQCLKW
jgi:hypothetical protein